MTKLILYPSTWFTNNAPFCELWGEHFHVTNVTLPKALPPHNMCSYTK